MAGNASTAIRDAWANAIESTVGTAPLFRFRTGAKPANAAAARSGTILATITCASDWIGASSSGVVTMIGSPTTTAIAAGTVGHWELMDSTGTTCHWQDTIGSGITLDTNIITAIGQNVTITSGAWTMGNA